MRPALTGNNTSQPGFGNLTVELDRKVVGCSARPYRAAHAFCIEMIRYVLICKELTLNLDCWTTEAVENNVVREERVREQTIGGLVWVATYSA
jgi:hypothetical protein